MAMIRVVQEPPNSDRCPWCGVTLGEPRRGTRRQIVLSARPGLFCWRCPDCGGVWAVRSVRHAPDEDEPIPVPAGARVAGAPAGVADRTRPDRTPLRAPSPGYGRSRRTTSWSVVATPNLPLTT